MPARFARRSDGSAEQACRVGLGGHDDERGSRAARPITSPGGQRTADHRSERAARAAELTSTAERSDAIAPGRSGTRGLVPVIAAGILWGTIGPAVEQLHRHGGLRSLDISFWRFVIASLAMTAFALSAGRSRWPAGEAAGRRRGRPAARSIGVGLLCGASSAVSQLCYFAALGELGIGPATLVALGLGPLLVALGEATFLGRRPSRRLLAVVAASVAGMVLLVGGAGTTAPHGGNVLAGVLLASGAAATYAAVVLVASGASRALGAGGLNLLVFLGGALSLAPVVAVSGLAVPSDAGAIALTAYLGLFASALAYGLYFLAARTLKSTVISVFALLEPLTASVLAWIVFGQELSALGIAGGALLLGGVLVLSRQDDLVAEAAPIGAAIPETTDSAHDA